MRFINFADLAQYYCQYIEDKFVSLFNRIEMKEKMISYVHVANLKKKQHHWTQLKTHLTCLYCLRRKSKHVLDCEHAICDICLRVFEVCVESFEYHYNIEIYFLCINKETLMIKVKSSTTSVRILSVDDDEIRDVVSLKFLNLLQNIFDRDLLLQDYFEQTFDINSSTSIDVICSWYCWLS